MRTDQPRRGFWGSRRFLIVCRDEFICYINSATLEQPTASHAFDRAAGDQPGADPASGCNAKCGHAAGDAAVKCFTCDAAPEHPERHSAGAGPQCAAFRSHIGRW